MKYTWGGGGGHQVRLHCSKSHHCSTATEKEIKTNLNQQLSLIDNTKFNLGGVGGGWGGGNLLTGLLQWSLCASYFF